MNQVTCVEPAKRGRDTERKGQKGCYIQPPLPEQSVERRASRIGAHKHRPPLVAPKFERLRGPTGIKLGTKCVFVIKSTEDGRCYMLGRGYQEKYCGAIAIPPAAVQDKTTLLLERLSQRVSWQHRHCVHLFMPTIGFDRLKGTKIALAYLDSAYVMSILVYAVSEA